MAPITVAYLHAPVCLTVQAQTSYFIGVKGPLGSLSWPVIALRAYTPRPLMALVPEASSIVPQVRILIHVDMSPETFTPGFRVLGFRVLRMTILRGHLWPSYSFTCSPTLGPLVVEGAEIQL